MENTNKDFGFVELDCKDTETLIRKVKDGNGLKFYIKCKLFSQNK